MIKYNNRTKKIRVGNDFICFWYIRRSSRPEDIINATDIVLTATNGDRVIPLEFSVVDTDTLKIEVKTDWADELGDYVFTVSYVLTDPSFSDDMRANKINKRAFKIVPKSEQANTYLELHLTSEVLTGFRGDPFEYDDFTQEQLDAIQQPILDFVVLAEDAEANREDKEADRRRYENSRKLSESDRVTKELERLEAESTRVTQEGTRETAEDIRKDNEQDRVTAEDLRLLAEPLRISQENDRKSNETIRINKEFIRDNSENDREENEDTRSVNEAIRITNEDDRIANENQISINEQGRVQAEKGRETAETTRVSNENNRVTAEEQRVISETTREQQEQERQTNTAIAITNAENAIVDVNAAKDDYYDVVKPDIIAQGEYATAQGDYAKEQGDYAKAQGEAVDGRVTALEEKVDKNITWYGVEWSTAIASSSMTRIGSMNLHRELPIQNKMKGVLLNNDGTVNKYLDENDWTSEVRDGTQGQVMVEMPEFYYKFEADGNIRRMLISDYALTGFEKMPKMYISAYEASLNGSNLSSEAGVMAKTSYSRLNFRNFARNRGDGWEMYFYNAHKSMLMLYFVEYANRNSQLNFNAQLTESGFKQGGLGAGVTTVISGEWSSYNRYNPFVECGFTDTLGNNTGVVTMDVPFGSVPTVDVPRYRGIENPFGHIWKNCDGINIDIKTDEDGGTSTCYICDDPAMFSDSSYEGYTNVGLLPRSNGYINEMLLGEFMPASVGGGSTTYWADQFYTSITSSSLRTVLWGGFANYGAAAGLGCSAADESPSSTAAAIGSRVCFFKKRNS